MLCLLHIHYVSDRHGLDSVVGGGGFVEAQGHIGESAWKRLLLFICLYAVI